MEQPTIPSAPSLPGWLWRPGAIVFVSNVCCMVLELVAGRIIAPHVGVSLYTWTTVIGVVLAGLSLGNFLGGRLADRWASPRLLGLVFLLGGLASLGILAVDAFAPALPGEWPIISQIVALTTVLFFVPCVILGCISPIVVKLAVRDLARTGSTVGRISAAGTAGSIVGTFATGFVLISWLGTHAIVWGVAVILSVMGLLFILAGRNRWFIMPALLLIAAGTVWASGRGWLRSVCGVETNYFCIRVQEKGEGRDLVRVLVLDRLVHSYNSLDDPARLTYGYEKIYAEIVAARAARNAGIDALFIGGGGYTFPRYMEALYPRSELDVIEIDPGVTRVAYDSLGLRRDTRIKSYNQDARLFLTQAPARRYDLILGDAFNDFSVPYHLTTREFSKRVKAWLSPDGVYLLNMIDGLRRDFLRAFVHTLRQSFRHVTVVPASAGWRDSPRMTYVLVASDAPLDLDALRAFAPDATESLVKSQGLSASETDALLAEGRAVTLTDDYAPVEQMLAPVFRGEAISQ